MPMATAELATDIRQLKTLAGASDNPRDKNLIAYTDDVLKTSYPMLVRTLANVVVLHVPGHGVWFTTMERGTYKISDEPHEVFEGGGRSGCLPAMLLFLEPAGAAASRAIRLSRGEAMARLTALSPSVCYDRTMAAAHLAVLGALATQARAWSLHAGRDLLDPMAASDVVAECVHKAFGRPTPP